MSRLNKTNHDFGVVKAKSKNSVLLMNLSDLRVKRLDFNCSCVLGTINGEFVNIELHMPNFPFQVESDTFVVSKTVTLTYVDDYREEFTVTAKLIRDESN